MPVRLVLHFDIKFYHFCGLDNFVRYGFWTRRFCVEENTPLLRSMIVHAPLRAQKIGAKILESFALYLDENKIGPTYCLPYDHLGNFYGLIGFKIINDGEAPLFLQERVQNYRKNSSDPYMVMRRD